MRCFLVFACTVLLVGLACGCDQSSSPPATAPAGANSPASATTPEADLSAVLAALTQALRKYSVEKRQVPASVNELVAAGYVKNLPQPPPGKTFAIDAKNVQVIVK